MGNVFSDSKVPPELRIKFANHGQEHVFQYVDSGVVRGKAVKTLVSQLNEIDPERMNALFQSTVGAAAKASLAETPKGAHGAVKKTENIEPIESFVTVDSAKTEDMDMWFKTGLKAIQEGKVAVIVLSGGQGTRLGFSGPKGMYDIGLPSKKTLFQLHAERLRRVCHLASEVVDSPNLPPSTARTDADTAATANSDCDTAEEKKSTRISIPWYIMTSPLNDAITRQFFAENHYFGVPESDVFFFPQGTLPCMTLLGKIMLESAGRVAMAPDGNGGIYPALQRTGALDDMRARGVEHLHVFAIDNALVKVADPHFLGYCIKSVADCGNKSVWKAEAGEKVGVVVNRGGKPCVVEYSEMDEEACERRNAEGKLVFGAANICNHYFSRAFLEDTVLPGMADMYHVAHKKIPTADGPKGETMKPSEINGIKLESFIFDVFPLSKNMVLFETLRADEFAPVKNAPGSSSDSPDTARQMISEQAKRWVVAAGGQLQEGSGDCEISPLVSYGGEGLQRRVELKGIAVPFHLEIEE